MLRADNPDTFEHVLTYDPRKFSTDPTKWFEGVGWIHHFRETDIAAPQVEPGHEAEAGPVVGWNRAAALSSGDILVLVSDDYFPPRHWDTEIIKAIGDVKREAVLWVRNVAYVPQGFIPLWDHLICHPIMTRPYYERLGYILPPWYFGRGTDNELTEIAMRDNVIIDVRKTLAFQHQDSHPAYEPLEENESNGAVTAHYQEDWDTYTARRARGFPKEWPVLSSATAPTKEEE